jgi:lipid A ethanolaminephosphotransferase
MQKFFRGAGPGYRPAVLVGAASLWIATTCNLPLWSGLWQQSAVQGARGLLFGAALALMIAAVLAAMTSLLAWRWTLKPALSVLLLASAAGAHFMGSYGVVIDPTMMASVLQTDPHEARDLVTVRMVVTVLLLGGLPALAVWRAPVRHAPWPRQMAHNGLLFLAGVAVLAAAVLVFFQPLASTMRNHHQLRYHINPLNSLYALGHAAAQPWRSGSLPLRGLGEDATLGASPVGLPRPPLLVLVLGETGRSGNFGINGYERATTPQLAGEDVVSFRNAWACGTSTAASVPCMFSHLGRGGFAGRKANFENLLDVIQHAGMAVLWIDNQAGCKGVCDRVASLRAADTPDPALCRGGECLDEVMLRGLDARIQALPAERRLRGVVVVLHQMGSHGPAYHKRSPPELKRFLPECASSALQDCSRQEVVNAYDNSIVYTDHFLASTIRWLRAKDDRDTAMVYVADHGESLGENNIYLHGLPYAIAPDVQKHVPWITWLSAGFERRTGVMMGCLQSLRDAPLTHDNYFHSVLGLLRVQTQAYQRSMDVYRSCREEQVALLAQR